jgi:hypothetical protein
MASRRRTIGFILAVLVAATCLGPPASAASRSRWTGDAIAVRGGAGEAVRPAWYERTWAWMVAVFGEENGSIVPCSPRP